MGYNDRYAAPRRPDSQPTWEDPRRFLAKSVAHRRQGQERAPGRRLVDDAHRHGEPEERHGAVEPRDGEGREPFGELCTVARPPAAEDPAEQHGGLLFRAAAAE